MLLISDHRARRCCPCVDYPTQRAVADAARRRRTPSARTATAASASIGVGCDRRRRCSSSPSPASPTRNGANLVAQRRDLTPRRTSSARRCATAASTCEQLEERAAIARARARRGGEARGRRRAAAHRAGAARRRRALDGRDRGAGRRRRARDRHRSRPRRRSRSRRSRTTSRSTLTEIRRMLGVLRADERRRVRSPRPASPTSTGSSRDLGGAGLDGRRARRRRRATTLPPGVDLTAYRIVQEALTNVLKHAGPGARDASSSATSPSALRLEITDDGRGVNGRARPAAATACSACASASASTAASLDAGPRAGGGFRVVARPALRGRRVIRVAVADDQALVRSGFAVLLRSAADIEVVGEAAERARGRRPRAARAARRRPHGHPHAGDGRARGDAPHHVDDATATTRVLILTTFDLDEYVFEALRAGASGFLLKDTLPDDLLAAVRVVADGEALLAPKVTRRLIEQFAQQPARRRSQRRPRPRHADRPRARGARRGRARACRTPRSPRSCSCRTRPPRPT